MRSTSGQLKAPKRLPVKKNNDHIVAEYLVWKKC